MDEEVKNKIEKWNILCNQYDVSLPAVAMKFGFAHNNIDDIAIGASRKENLQQNLDLLNVDVD